MIWYAKSSHFVVEIGKNNMVFVESFMHFNQITANFESKNALQFFGQNLKIPTIALALGTVPNIVVVWKKGLWLEERILGHWLTA